MSGRSDRRAAAGDRSRRAAIRRRRLVALAALVVLAVAIVLLAGGLPHADQKGARVAGLTVTSKAVGRDLPVKVVVPAGSHAQQPGRRRPLLVFLHGRSGNQDSSLGDPMFAALAKLGPRAPIVAFPYGGDHSYWHDRADGAWGRYIVDEVIPQVIRSFGADPRRVAIGGISMGGFGAYDLARLHPGRFCAVGGHSPAIWANSGLTAPGAFDSAEDFARHDLVASAATPLRGTPVWLDAGSSDPFRPGDQAFAAALRAAGTPITVKSWPGGHDRDYWNRHWGSYLRFYAAALANCRPR
ncbi:MAG: hypothetical protein QOJ38_1540 [Solirubrobacterales bacterium]|nr:hypothetical protein [Solirubrobacterales bacterium]